MNKCYDKNLSWNNRSQDKEIRSCFCVGPENCNDITCPLVKQLKAKQIKLENEDDTTTK